MRKTKRAPDYELKRKFHRETEEARKKRREYLDRPEVRSRVNALRRKRRSEKDKTPSGIISNRIRVVIHRSLRTNRNNTSWRKFVDYRIDELRVHLERQFLRGMNWENMGEWHIDHIIPIADFDYSKHEEIRRCWDLTNLRPLWAKENSRKSDKRIFLL